MKLFLYAISAFLMLSFTSTTTLAYSGSECEVQDCSNSKPTKANTKATKGQPKTKAEVKGEAKTQAKTKSPEKASTPLQNVTGFFK